MCGEVSGLRDWIIAESRHAKSFSRFLLDTDEAIWITLQTGVDLLVVTPHQPVQARAIFSAWNENTNEPLFTMLSGYCILP